MRRTRAADNAVALPAMSDSETGGYYTAGPPATVFSADDANIIQEELVGIAGLLGVALDTTGANVTQCATAVQGVKAIVAKNVEASAVDSYWKMAVVASTDATVGEDDGGVIHAAAIASDSCKARGFESAAIASEDCNAGNAGGTSNHVAVIASNKVAVEGDESAAIASECTISGTATATATRGAMVAASFDTAATFLTGTDVAIIAANDAIVKGSRCAVVGGVANTIDDGAGGVENSAIFGGDTNTIESDYCAILGGQTNHIDGTGASWAAIVGGASNLIDGTGPQSSVIVGGGSNHIADSQNSAIVGGTGNALTTGSVRSVIIGGQDNTIDTDDCAIIGSQDSIVQGSDGCVLLGSRYVDVDAGSNETNYMVCGGYDAATLVAPEWLIQSEGGAIYATDITVNSIDYAELFENADGKAHPPGRILSRAGKGCRLAKRGQRVLGVVSVTPTVLGGDDSLGWNNQFLRDEWGAFVRGPVEEVNRLGPDPVALKEARRRRKAHAAQLSQHKLAIKHARRMAPTDEHARARLTELEAVTIPALDLSDLDLTPRESRREVVVRLRNPEWDRSRARQHVPRKRRPDEWTKVGLLGQVRVAVDATVTEGDFVEPGDVPGVGTRTASNGPAPGRPIECMEITSPFDEERGYAIALCLVG